MNPVNVYDNVGPGQSFLFNPKFVNLDYIFYKIYVFFSQLFGFGKGTGVAVDGDSTGKLIINSPSGQAFNFPLGEVILKDILYVLIVFFLTVIAYCIIRMYEIRNKEAQYIQSEIERYAREQKEAEMHQSTYQSKNPRWDQVVRYMNSDNPSEWRLAIMEADTMLNDLLERLGFKGETLGERLKSTDAENFRGLNFAWEAHAVRNKVAHEGSDYVLNIREASRIISLYEQIFRDYDFI